MAKRDIVELKKGIAQFTLIGKAVVNDFTFGMNKDSSKSDWIYNQLKLGVATPEQGTVFAEMMGGYGSERANRLFVHGKKMNDNNKEVDDYSTRWEMDWDDRLDESLHDTIGESCFITIGVEKDDKDKTFYKKFLSQYDAIEYLQKHLEKDMIIMVRGNLNYSVYDNNTQCKKEITSVVLSKQPEDKHGAFFTQTILVDSDSVEKIDKEKNSYAINAYVVDYVNKVDIDGKKVEVKGNAVFGKRFEALHTDDVKTPKLLKMMFGAKKEEVFAVNVEGVISKGASLVTATVDDLPDDIKELIEYGAMTEEEALDKCVGKGSKVETYIIQKPKIKVTEKDGVRTPSVEIDKGKYERMDYVTYEQLLASKGVAKKEELVVDEDEEFDFGDLMDEDDEDVAF